MRRALKKKMRHEKNDDVSTHPTMVSTSSTARHRYFRSMVVAGDVVDRVRVLNSINDWTGGVGDDDG